MSWSQNGDSSSEPSGGAWRQLAGGLLGGAIVLATVLGSILLATQEAPPSSATAIAAVSSTVPPSGAHVTPPPSATPVSGFTPLPITPAPPLITPTAACPVPPGWTAYTVRDGDTLLGIAEAHGTTVFALIQGNCLGEIELTAGQTLYVPPPPTRGPTPEPTRCGPPRGWIIYRVQPGDTLYGLAVRYQTSVSALASANCLTAYTLRVGQPLYVPPTPAFTPTSPISPLPTATSPPAPIPSNTPVSIPSDTPVPSPLPESSPTPTSLASGTPIPTWTPPPTDTSWPELTPTVPPTDVIAPSPTVS